MLNSGLIVLQPIDWLVEWLGDLNHCQAPIHGSVSTEEGLIISSGPQSLLVLGFGYIEVVEEGAHSVRTQTDVYVFKFKLSISLKVPAVIGTTSSHASRVDVNSG